MFRPFRTTGKLVCRASRGDASLRDAGVAEVVVAQQQLGFLRDGVALARLGDVARTLVKHELAVNGVHVDDPPAGLDQINWRALLALLYKAGYAGNLSIEPHSSTWQGDLGERGLDLTIRYMRSLMV